MTREKNEELPPDLYKEFIKIAVIQGIKKDNLSTTLLQKIEQDPSLLDKQLPHGKTWAHLACRSGAARDLPPKQLTAETLLQKDTRNKICPLQVAQKTKNLYTIQKNLTTETLRAILKNQNLPFLTPLSKKSLAKQIRKNELRETLSQLNHPAL